MNKQDYRNACLRTWIGPDAPGELLHKKERISNAMLGICGEAWEVIESKNEKSELGDLLYYLEVYVHEMGVHVRIIESVYPPSFPDQLLMMMVLKLSEFTKKQIYHNTDMGLEIECTLFDIYKNLVNRFGECETFETIRYANIEKLNRRYPPKRFCGCGKEIESDRCISCDHSGEEE